VDLVRVATVSFHLYRHMFMPKSVLTGADGMQKVIGQRRIIPIDEYMTGHHNQPRFDGPDMEVVTFFQTPGIASMVAATCEALIFGGVDSSKTSSDSFKQRPTPFAIATTPAS